ncbi:MAG: hypothetical protein ACO22S_05040 [Burkholderiaceae bacterium]
MKSKNWATLLPHTVLGLLLLPPKYSLPSWKVAVLGQPLPEDHTSSYPDSSSQLPLAMAVVSKNGISVTALTTVALVYATILALPWGLALMYWPTDPALNTPELAVSVTSPDFALGVRVPAGLDREMVNAYFGTLTNDMLLTVQLASVPPRTILIGLMSL